MQLITNMLFLQSHFSLKKGAAALGIGTDSVILIKCDERWAWICNPCWLAICKFHTYVYLLVWKQVMTMGAENLAAILAIAIHFLFHTGSCLESWDGVPQCHGAFHGPWLSQNLVKSIKIFCTKMVHKDIHQHQQLDHWFMVMSSF